MIEDTEGEIFEVGDEITSAIWFHAGQRLEPLRHRIEADIFVRAQGLRLGDITVEIWGPNHLRLTNPPKPGMLCLVALAVVIGITSEGLAFWGGLDARDLERLRRSTRKVGRGYNHRMTDRECDEVIARAGEAALRDIVSKA